MPGEDSAKEDKGFLDEVGRTYTKGSLQDKAIRELIVRTFEPYLDTSKRGLQLGYSEGIDTGLLCEHVAWLDVVDGSQAFVDEGLKRGLANAAFRMSLFEDFALGEGDEPYDYVFAVYVFEHVRDVTAVLRMARSVLKPGGLLFVVVPNARALSRQLALHMGIVKDLKELTPHDTNHGHRRVYDRVSLNRDLEQEGFRIIAQGGIMLKILADFQLDRLMADKVLGPDHIDGLYRLGLEYPDLCGSLFAVCGQDKKD